MWFIDYNCLEEKLFYNKLTNIDILRNSQGNFQKKQRLCLYHIYKKHYSPIPLDRCSFLTPLTKNCAALRFLTRKQREGKASNKIFSFLELLEFDEFYEKNFVAYLVSTTFKYW